MFAGGASLRGSTCAPMPTEITTLPTAALAAVCLASVAASAWAETGQPVPVQAPSMARMVRLPVSGLQVVETTEGELLFLSDNGRYALRGPALDLWHGAKLVSFDETARLAGRIDLGRLKLDVGDLGAIDVGEGSEVTIFVDPLCSDCSPLYEALLSLVGTYRFRLVPVPVLGEPSQHAVLALACLSASDPGKARDALLGNRVPGLPESTGVCGQGTAQRAVIAAQILGIRGTPFLIAPDGRVREGAPGNLAAWLVGEGEGAP